MANRVSSKHLIKGIQKTAPRQLRGHAVALLVAMGLAVPGGARAATPYASTLNDLCPGTPNPCVVTGKFLVSDATTFNLGGRALQLSSTAALTADNGASFSITNAGAVTLYQGSALTAPGKGTDAGSITIESTGACSLSGKIQANATIDYILGGGDGGGVTVDCDLGISLSASSIIEANGADGPGGVVDLYARNLLSLTADITAAKGAKIRAEGASGQTGGYVHIRTDHTCTLAANIEADGKVRNDPIYGPSGGDGGMVIIDCEQMVDLRDGATVIAGSGKTAQYGQVKIYAIRGTVDTASTGTVKIQVDGYQGALVDPAILIRGEDNITLRKGTVVTGIAKGHPGAPMIVTSDLGSCIINGKIIANGEKDSSTGLGGQGGTVDVLCEGIDLGESSVVEAKGAANPAASGRGGTITLDATTAWIYDYSTVRNPFAAAKGAKINVQSKGDGGGEVEIVSDADCTLGAAISADSSKVTDLATGDVYGGAGGQVELDCAGDIILSKDAKIVAGSDKTNLAGSVSINAYGWCSINTDEKCLGDNYCPDFGTGEVCVPSGHCTVSQGTSCTSDAGCPAGEICVQVQLDQNTIQNDGIEGDLAVMTAGPLEIGGKLQSRSIYEISGAIGIDVHSGGFVLGSKGLLESNTAGYQAGRVEILVRSGPCDISGDINAKGSLNKGERGVGGSVEVTCETNFNVNKTAVIDASGSGSDSDGGGIELISPYSGVTLAGKLLANGVRGGGAIYVTAIGIITTVDSSVSANGNSAGEVTLRSGTPLGATLGSVLIQKSVSAKGSGTSSTGGQVNIEACNVTVDTKGTVSTDGTTGGGNSLTAHKKLTINGKLSAKASGVNTLVYRDEYSIPYPGYIIPASPPTQNLSLSSCPW
ncbi:MAG: hypothetical protein HY699_02795 [Deltaproteobacteria bacterium]|nr:hypothetical protein [Deltaproteobacteria bacterium]